MGRRPGPYPSLLTEHPDPRSGTGQPVAEARSALRPLPQIKLDCPPLPAPGYRRRTGNPLLLRGELTLDFPLPAPASGGQRSQPSLEPMTDDGPVRPTILPGLGGGGAPSHAPGTPPSPHYLNVGSRIQQASFIADPKPTRQNGNRNPTTEEKAGVSLTYRTSTHRRRPPPQCCIIARGPRGHVVGSRRAAS